MRSNARHSGSLMTESSDHAPASASEGTDRLGGDWPRVAGLAQRTVGNRAVVVAVGGFPPPITGAAKNLTIICSDIERSGVRLVRKNIARGAVIGRWRGLPRRIMRYTVAWGSLARNVRSRPRTLYLTSDGGPGLWLTLLTVIVGRALRYRIVLQHRTYQYVRRVAPAMRLVNRSLGREACHVFLCNGMRDQFFRNYGERCAHFVNSDYAQQEPFYDELRRVQRTRPEAHLTVGYLSNLMPEKGFETFMAVAEESGRRALPWRFVMAGPAPSDEVERLVRSAASERGSVLEWLGGVFGTDKAAFFRSIDVLLFPTQYRYEAQPNVVLEALCAGALVLATDVGCVKDSLGRWGGEVLPVDRAADIEGWLEQLELISADREAANTRRWRSLVTARRSVRNAQHVYLQVLDHIAGTPRAWSPDGH